MSKLKTYALKHLVKRMKGPRTEARRENMCKPHVRYEYEKFSKHHGIILKKKKSKYRIDKIHIIYFTQEKEIPLNGK